VLGTVFLVNKSGIDMEDPTILQGVRTAYVVVKLLEIIINLFIFNKLKQRQQNKDDYTTKKLYFPGPANPFDPVPKYEEEPKTVSEHEQAKINQNFQQVVMGFVIMGFLHLKMGVVQPLMIQSIISPIRLFKNELFQIYILGNTTDDNPWKALDERPTPVVQEENNTPVASTTSPIANPSDDAKSDFNEAKSTDDDDVAGELIQSVKDEVSKIINVQEDYEDFEWLMQVFETNKELIDTQNEAGITATMAAANFPKNEVALQTVEELILDGASCCIQDSEGNTALHHAVIKNNLAAVKTILSQDKTDINAVWAITNKSGQTALDIAQSCDFDDIVQIFKTAKNTEATDNGKLQENTGIRKRNVKKEDKGHEEDDITDLNEFLAQEDDIAGVD